MENRKANVNVKSAVRIAIDYVKDLYSDSNLRDLMLEEVELSEATNQWLITVGFSPPETNSQTQSLIMPSKTGQTLSRRYKVVNIDAATGQPVSMRIRTISGLFNDGEGIDSLQNPASRY
ncbi:MAG: hypothetical protein F6K30_26650 [Cyanothece sp. SIO2G6]|nr:hypothetical protein [Cyanothece sp. SIO2G6]